jgi:hypothetical protein
LKSLRTLTEKYIIRTGVIEKMEEIVIALLMIVNQEIKEHRIQPSMSTCLKGKRIAMRTNTGSNVQYQCLKSMAETEIYLGEKSIKKLILN